MKLHNDNFKIAGEVAVLNFTKKTKNKNNKNNNKNNKKNKKKEEEQRKEKFLPKLKTRFSLLSVTLEKTVNSEYLDQGTSMKLWRRVI